MAGQKWPAVVRAGEEVSNLPGEPLKSKRPYMETSSHTPNNASFGREVGEDQDQPMQPLAKKVKMSAAADDADEKKASSSPPSSEKQPEEQVESIRRKCFMGPRASIVEDQQSSSSCVSSSSSDW